MADIVSQDKRSQMMAGIKSRNTNPEIVIRKLLHGHGFRFRINYSKLPGKPDLVFPKYKAIIFINGCFWHGHECPMFRWPDENNDFWWRKITRNRERDTVNNELLLKTGWRILTIWECAIKGRHKLSSLKLAELAEKWLLTSDLYSEIYGFSKSDTSNLSNEQRLSFTIL